jgi:hypothetical protein
MRSLAAAIQSKSTHFRKMQRSYLDARREQDDMGDSLSLPSSSTTSFNGDDGGGGGGTLEEALDRGMTHEQATQLEQMVGGASALVTFSCVLCTLRTQISRSICNFTQYSTGTLRSETDRFSTLRRA